MGNYLRASRDYNRSLRAIQRRTYQRDSIILLPRLCRAENLRSDSKPRVAFLSISFRARKHTYIHTHVTYTPRCVLYHEPRCTSKDRVSWKIAGPFVKCKIRNTSPQKWNKPRHTGWYHWRRGTGGGYGNRNGGVGQGGGWWRVVGGLGGRVSDARVGR